MCALWIIVMSVMSVMSVQINSGCLFVPLLTCQNYLHYVDNLLQLFLFIYNVVF